MSGKKVFLGLGLAGAVAVATEVKSAAPSDHFVSTVQIAVQESSPQLLRRSQNLAIKSLAAVFESLPRDERQQYEIKRSGTEVVAYLVSSNNVRELMAKAVAQVFADLKDRTQAKGMYRFFRAPAEQSVGRYQMVWDPEQGRQIVSVSAKSVPFRDILQNIRGRTPGMNYLISNDCGDRLVDWSMASPGERRQVDDVMRELATRFRLKLMKQRGSYVLDGECPGLKQNPRYITTAELMPSRTMPGVGGYTTTQVLFPFARIGD